MIVACVLATAVIVFGVFSALIGVPGPSGIERSEQWLYDPIAAVVLAGCGVGAWYVMTRFGISTARQWSRIFSGIPRPVFNAVMAAGIVSFLLLAPPVGTWSLVAGIPLVLVGLTLLSRGVAHRVLSKNPFVENVLVLGKTELARLLVAEMAKRPRYRVLDVVDPGRSGRVPRDGTPFLPPSEFFERSGSRPQRIVIALSERRGRIPTEALLDAKRQGIAVEDGAQFFERLTGQLALDWLQPSHLILSPRFCPSKACAGMQRLVSVLLAGAGLALSLPLLALIAVLIKVDSPGPVLFVQERIGLGGRPFRLLKFRTMHPVVKRTSEWVRDNGDRITRVGRWLRQFRLDELPQLYNVLMGHMNLVGPRPHPASNYELFMTHIPFYTFRGLVRPGITGWAQVRYGYANNLEEETEKMRFDLYYIKHLSLWMDMGILARTIKVVLLGQHRIITERRDLAQDARVLKRLDAA